jgi:hypothetical protein
MLDAIGTILVGAALAVILAAIVASIPLRLSGRLVLAGTAGAWAGSAAAAAAAGAFSNPLTVLAMFGAPLAVVAVLAFGIPATRHAFEAVPLPVLVGLNIFRLGGVLFVFLALAGRLSGPFPYSAGWGDFATGALAIPVVGLAASRTRTGDRLILAWNTFGILDLIAAVMLGLVSRNGSPLQLIHAGVGTAAMLALPWAFIPAVLVPFFLVVHAVIFGRLRKHRAEGVGRRPISVGSLGRAG